MGAERKYELPRTAENSPSSTANPPALEDKPENQPREIKIGKMIFYTTVAVALWFFYWFNGIQCPC